MGSPKSIAIRKIFGAAVPKRTYEQHFGRTAPDVGDLSESIRKWIDDGWDSWDAWLDSDHTKFPQYVRDVEAIVQENIRDLQARGQEITHAMITKLMSAAALERRFTFEELALYWGGEEKIPPAARKAYKATKEEKPEVQ